jgi:hypothetical protein
VASASDSSGRTCEVMAKPPLFQAETAGGRIVNGTLGGRVL